MLTCHPRLRNPLQYSELIWNFNHFSGVDWDNKAGKKAVFLIEGKGKGKASNHRLF